MSVSNLTNHTSSTLLLFIEASGVTTLPPLSQFTFNPAVGNVSVASNDSTNIAPASGGLNTVVAMWSGTPTSGQSADGALLISPIGDLLDSNNGTLFTITNPSQGAFSVSDASSPSNGGNGNGTTTTGDKNRNNIIVFIIIIIVIIIIIIIIIAIFGGGKKKQPQMMPVGQD